MLLAGWWAWKLTNFMSVGSSIQLTPKHVLTGGFFHLHTHPLPVKCWAIVADVDPILKQRWVCLVGVVSIVLQSDQLLELNAMILYGILKAYTWPTHTNSGGDWQFKTVVTIFTCWQILTDLLLPPMCGLLMAACTFLLHYVPQSSAM